MEKRLPKFQEEIKIYSYLQQLVKDSTAMIIKEQLRISKGQTKLFGFKMSRNRTLISTIELKS